MKSIHIKPSKTKLLIKSEQDKKFVSTGKHVEEFEVLCGFSSACRSVHRLQMIRTSSLLLKDIPTLDPEVLTSLNIPL